MPKTDCPFDLANAEFEIRLFELGLEREPENLALLELLAYAYTAAGKYADGLKMDIRLVETEPDNEHYLYNLACSFSLIGDGASAVETLLRAVEEGYERYDEMIADDDLANARDYPSFGMVIAAMRSKDLL